MLRLLVVCLGSAVGGGARYLVSTWVVAPSGTRAVNVLGSFLIAFIMFAGLESAAISPKTRLALTTGVMGGFTTYSTFNQETLVLLQQGSTAAAFANVAATLLTCLAAAFAGQALARVIAGA